MRERFEKGVKSFPIKIIWDVWETDTLRLTKAGWQLAAEQDIYQNTLSLLLKHPSAPIYGYSGRITCEYMADMRYFEHMVIRIQHLANNLIIHMVDNIMKLVPISGYTQRIAKQEIRNIEDFKIFEEIKNATTPPLILPKNEAPDILDMIRNKVDQNYYNEQINKRLLIPEQTTKLITVGNILK